MHSYLKKNKEFTNVYRNGKSYANRYLVMYVCKNDREEKRFGISVSKRVGNSVIRHRVKRLVKESFRLNSEKYKDGYDIVIVSRVLAKGRNYREIDSALLHLGKIHHIIRDEYL